MQIYDKPTKVLMREWAVANLQPGQIFTKAEPVKWFAEHYSKIKRGTVEAHLEAMATNNGRIRQHHPHVREGSEHDLFFKVERGRFRLWDPQNDPKPEYNAPVVSEPGPESESRLVTETDPPTSAALREFAYEKDLQNFLARNLAAIEPGLQLFEDEGLTGIEYPAGGRYIDLLARDAAGKLVVIELKVSIAYDRVVGQIARYMAWARTNLECPAGVRGIIIANDISSDLRLAASELNGIELFEYDIAFSLKRVAVTS